MKLVMAVLVGVGIVASGCTPGNPFGKSARDEASGDDAKGASPELPALRPEDLRYVGAFRVPSTSGKGFSYGGTAVAFNAARNSLFMVGHVHEQRVAEISIPEPVESDVIEDLPVASFLQKFADPTDGLRQAFEKAQGPVRIGDLLVDQERLYGTVYVYYDGDSDADRSHFISSLDLSREDDVRGLFRVGNVNPGATGGYLAHVPPEWQPILGAPVFTGQCCIAIIGRSSYGPAVFRFDPLQLGKTEPVPAQPLLYYPARRPLAGWDATSRLFNGTSRVRGLVFPEGTRTLLFFGRHGLGKFCYGTGGVGPKAECHDPENRAKGTHAYPYRPYVWAYDASDLAKVRRGDLEPWEPRPSWVSELRLPIPQSTELGGAAYDAGGRRIYVSQLRGERRGCCSYLPIVHVFEVAGSRASP